tara:strand:- start:32 stop:268 length:237 start_codon:yes stop_codon:yes gene_type:complete
MTSFAKVEDKEGKFLYLASSIEEEIENHCKEKDLVITDWCNNVTPIMVIKHFKWVGKRRNPFVVARPFKHSLKSQGDI